MRTLSVTSRMSLPIRVKIVLLIASALAFSLLSYLYIGTSLIIQDKTSYIYDYNLTQLKSVSDGVEGQIQKTITTARMLGSLVAPGSKQINPELIKQAYAEIEKTAGVSHIVFLRPVDQKRFSIDLELGKVTAENKTLVDQLGWTPAMYNKEPVLVGASRNGKIPVGARIVDNSGQPIAFIALVEPHEKLFESGLGKIAQLYLVDASGATLRSNGATNLDHEKFVDLKRSLLESGFPSGVREWNSNDQDFIVGYQRFGYNQLVILSLVSKDIAFTAAKTLTHRSIFLGVSILLLAIGVTLIFVKGMTKRLGQLWNATQKVSEGDFSCRVDFGKTSNDEIGGLADSFNTMAQKIEELMVHTAEKARMEKELETAQVLQNRFFPLSDFEHDSIALSGKSVAASECGGDWWYYAKFENHLVVVIGDVTGHGVSAALVTASAHGAFSILMSQLKSQPDVVPSPKEIVKYLNEAILASAGKEATMTFIASVIDLRSGVMSLVNASHRPPYVYRKKADVPLENAIKHFKPLMGAQGPALGLGQDLSIDPVTFQLEPGDMVFWYTDGLVECESPDGKMITKQQLTKMLLELAEKNDANAKTICDQLLHQSLEFFGENATHLADDITVVVGTIPKKATLLKAAA
ncbi:MAG: SpoIIE family protein phosphatase [Bdellovibrionota bacterium]